VERGDARRRAQALATDFAPLTDSARERRLPPPGAQNPLRRLWLETRAEAPLTTHETSV
jgi:xanthine dehydrogenase iron-sulfur cluster and FAD-binding subunit A